MLQSNRENKRWLLLGHIYSNCTLYLQILNPYRQTSGGKCPFPLLAGTHDDGDDANENKEQSYTATEMEWNYYGRPA